MAFALYKPQPSIYVYNFAATVSYMLCQVCWVSNNSFLYYNIDETCAYVEHCDSHELLRQNAVQNLVHCQLESIATMLYIMLMQCCLALLQPTSHR